MQLLDPLDTADAKHQRLSAESLCAVSFQTNGIELSDVFSRFVDFPVAIEVSWTFAAWCGSSEPLVLRKARLCKIS